MNLIFACVLCQTGQVPGSPKLSSFPNLPDMSPKKVSAAHNVYVSPLRQTKVCLHARLCNSV